MKFLNIKLLKFNQKQKKQGDQFLLIFNMAKHILLIILMDYKTFGYISGGFLVGALAASIFYRSNRASQIKQSQKPSQEKEPQQQIHQSDKKDQSPQSYESEQQYNHLKGEQLARIIKFFGQQKFKTLQNSFVIVFGVGGVGSHVVNMLARSGVRRIRIIDFDTVSLSSLNRHSFAVRQDVGTPKVECIKKYVHKIFPHIRVQCVNVYATVQNVRTLLVGNYEKVLDLLNQKQQKNEIVSFQTSMRPDYIIDCIDNLDAKVQLISACLEGKYKLIVSGGAGMKNDPTKLQIRDVSDCKYDKLIMRLKRELSKKEIKSGFKVVYSYQQSQKQLLPLTEVQQKNPQAFKVFDNYRIRIVPVLGTMPAIIGMTIASYVLCDLAGEPYQPFQTDYVKSSSISKLYNELLYEVKKRGFLPENLKVDIEQVSILAKKVYNWKCVINPEKKGDRLAIWDRTKPITIDNLALMTKQNSDRHMKSLTLEELGYDQEVLQRFQQSSKYSKKLMQSGYMMFI